MKAPERAAEPSIAVVHPSDTFHDKHFACDQGDDGDYDIRWTPFMISTLHKTSIPLPSDTFHDRLFPFDQSDLLIN